MNMPNCGTNLMPFNTPHCKAYSYLGDECRILERFFFFEPFAILVLPALAGRKLEVLQVMSWGGICPGTDPQTQGIS